jgi:hypothetical protein
MRVQKSIPGPDIDRILNKRPAGSEQNVTSDPDTARDYHIFAYPIIRKLSSFLFAIMEDLSTF